MADYNPYMTTPYNNSPFQNYYQPTTTTTYPNYNNNFTSTPLNNNNVNPLNNNSVPTMQEMQKAYSVYQWLMNSNVTGEEIDALSKIKKEKSKDEIEEFLGLRKVVVENNKAVELANNEIIELKKSFNDYMKSNDDKIDKILDSVKKIESNYSSIISSSSDGRMIEEIDSTSSIVTKKK